MVWAVREFASERKQTSKQTDKTKTTTTTTQKHKQKFN